MTSEYTWTEQVEDDAALRRAIEEQEAVVRRLEGARVGAARRGRTEASEEAEYNLHQARRYLDELTADLSDIGSAPVSVPENIPAPSRRRVRRAPATRSGLAVVIGHSAAGDMGAAGIAPPFSPEPKLGGCEYYWNKEIAEWIKADLLARGVRCEVFHRERNAGPGILEAYRQVKEWGPAATVELHFNSVPGGVGRGTETIYELDGSKAWATAIQGAMVKLYGHEGKKSERGAKLDRGIKKASENGRGKLSLVQIAPSVITEPFFANNLVDADLGVSKKRDLAAAIVSTFIEHAAGAQAGAGTATSSTGTAADTSTTQPAQPVDPVTPATTAASLWDQLREAYSAAPASVVEFPHLKGITFAQWGYESGHGTSLLAREHLNFGGLKYREFLAGVATPVPYTDSGGRRDNYCKFATFENFLKGYWSRFDNISNYNGWRNHTATPDAYIRFIANIYAPPSENAKYLPNVLSIYERYKNAGKLPRETPVASPDVATGTAADTAAGAAPVTDTSTGAPPVTDTSTQAGPVTDTASGSQPSGGVSGTAGSSSSGPLPSDTASQTVPGSTPPAQPAFDLVAAARRIAPPGGHHFLALVEAYAAASVAHPGLKTVTTAQWALESDWGRSRLAEMHYNFAGIEWASTMAGLAAPVDYKKQDGTSAVYCRFLTLDDFIKGYWARLERDPRFAGWQAETGSPEAFLEFVAPRWRPSPEYVRSVANIVARLGAPAPIGTATSTIPSSTGGTSPGTGTAQPGTGAAPLGTGTTPQGNGTPPAGTTTTPPSPELNLDGFIIKVTRVRTELREGKGYARTVGTYQAFFKGEPIPGLEGVCFERQGPGDNGPTGRQYARRVTAGAYPLHTQAGAKYKTYNYSPDRSYAKPGVLLGNTGYREAILWHPGEGYLSSIGCLNFSSALSGPTDSIRWEDSRARVIAMIEAMKQKLAGRFPATNGKLIPDAWIVITGEPDNTRMATRRWRGLSDETGVTRRSRGGEMEPMDAPVSLAEAFELIAATMNAQVLPERVNLRLFEALARGRGDLGNLRNDDGENLWLEWTSGWQGSFAIGDIDTRARVQSELVAIASRLKDAGVNINDNAGRRTPLTAAATGNQWEAIAFLHDAGAELDLRDRTGNSPLTTAAFNGSLETVEYLVGAGADKRLATVEAQPASVSRSGDVEASEGEGALAGSTALDCARLAKQMMPEGDVRRGIYDRIEAALR